MQVALFSHLYVIVGFFILFSVVALFPMWYVVLYLVETLSYVVVCCVLWWRVLSLSEVMASDGDCLLALFIHSCRSSRASDGFVIVLRYLVVTSLHFV